MFFLLPTFRLVDSILYIFFFKPVHSAHLSESQGTRNIKNANPLKRSHSPQNASPLFRLFEGVFLCVFFGGTRLNKKKHLHWLRIMPCVSAGTACWRKPSETQHRRRVITSSSHKPNALEKMGPSGFACLQTIFSAWLNYTGPPQRQLGSQGKCVGSDLNKPQCAACACWNKVRSGLIGAAPDSFENGDGAERKPQLAHIASATASTVIGVMK